MMDAYEAFARNAHLVIDTCYIKNVDMCERLNVVVPCPELNKYILVLCIFLEKKNRRPISCVIKNGFQEIQKLYFDFDEIQRCYANYVNSEDHEHITVDFSDAVEVGLRQALGDTIVDKLVRWCKFHFLQSAAKVARLAADNEYAMLIMEQSINITSIQ